MAGRAYCVDLRSKSGTFWENGGEGSGWLDRDETIRLGPYQIRFLGFAGRATTPVANGSRFCPLQALLRDQDAMPGLVLDFQKEDAQPVHWRMKQMLALCGKSSRCKVRLGGPEIQSFHASLLRTGRNAWAIDLGGGIEVNGAPVRFARLEQGDQLQIATFSMRVRFEQPRSTLPAVVPPPIVAHPLAADQLKGTAVEAVLASLSQMNPAAPWPALWPNLGTNPFSTPDPFLLQMMGQFGLMQQQMLAQQQQTMTVLCQLIGPLLKERRAGLNEDIERLQQVTRELQEVQAELARRDQAAPSTPPRPAPATAPAPETPPPTRPAPEPQPAAPTAPSPPPLFEMPMPPPADGGRPHSWLVERMAALQKEQQTRWQRIMSQVRSVLVGSKE
jgi:hypothetical protein